MVRSISLAAVLSLTLLGLVVASLGVSPDASVLEPVTFDGKRLEPDDPAARRPQTPVVPAARSPAMLAAVRLGAPTLPAEPAPVLHPLAGLVRPPARSFWATGPLVARVSDPTFGPIARPADPLVPDPPARLAEASDLLCMAVAIYHEARGESLDGQLAVASVILNRTEEPERWGATPCDVVVPIQFSFFAEDGSYPTIPKDEAWAIAVEMAREALERGPSTLVGGADHYHTPAVDPDWAEAMDQVVQIENHLFFVDPERKG